MFGQADFKIADRLTLTGGITAYSSNAASTSAITAGNLEIGSGVRTVTVHPITADGTAGGTVISPYAPGLSIAAIIQTAVSTGSLAKAGAGNLQLGGANTFGVAGSTGVDLQAGGLILNVAGALGAGNLLVSGSGTALSSSSAITVTNPVVLANAATSLVLGQFGASTLTLSGPVTWSASSGVVCVNRMMVAGT